MTKRIASLLGTVLALSLVTTQARAHWCNDLWGSAYNIVVRPASDTVTVPASGSASLDIYVQNNMGYLLPNFVLSAKTADTKTKITASRQTQKVANTLMPGEKAKYTLAISNSSGGSVAVSDITFGVTFGDSGQSGLYPSSSGKAVMIKKSDGSLAPAAPPPGIGSGNGQARQLQGAAVADFSNVDTGLNKLMSLYCAGRKSWGADDDSVIGTACSGTATDCAKATRSVSADVGTKFDYTKLWAAGELAARKSSLGDRAATLRTRLQCGASDANLTFAGYAMMVMGYLGDDAGARTFLEGKVGTSELGTIAKAALVLMGDKDKYGADMTAGLKASSKFVQAACAAALGITNLDDATVNSVLIPLAKWDEPDVKGGEIGFFASHLLSMVAWDRRGWAANADDKGPVTFYEGGTPTPTGGSSGSGGTATTPTGGSSGSKPAGSTAVTSGGAKAGAVASSARPGGNTTPTSSAKGGNTTPVSSGDPPVGGSPMGGQPAGGAEDPGSSDPEPIAGNSGSEQNTFGTAGAGGHGASVDSGAKSAGAAGGCTYGPTAPAPLAFLIAALGLALALRRRG